VNRKIGLSKIRREPAFVERGQQEVRGGRRVSVELGYFAVSRLATERSSAPLPVPLFPLFLFLLSESFQRYRGI
jgi:hypothetical protein